MIIPPWSEKAKRPCRTCPYHAEARGTLLMGVGCLMAVTVGATWGLADRYATIRENANCNRNEAPPASIIQGRGKYFNKEYQSELPPAP